MFDGLDWHTLPSWIQTIAMLVWILFTTKTFTKTRKVADEDREELGVLYDKDRAELVRMFSGLVGALQQDINEIKAKLAEQGKK